MSTKGKPTPAKAATPAAASGPADPKHPDVHPDRHIGGAQEMPTSSGATPSDADKDSGAGTHQAALQPNPSIGVTYDDGVKAAGTAPVDGDDLADQDHVFSHEQALSLPVLEAGEKGTPVKAPKEGSKAHKELDGKVPVLSFKDADRRTLVVVKHKGALAAQVTEPTDPA